MAARTWLRGHLAGAARGPGTDRDSVEVERDHLRVRAHAGQARGRSCWPAGSPAAAHHRPAADRSRFPRVAQRRDGVAVVTRRWPRRRSRRWRPAPGVPPRRPRSCPPPAISGAMARHIRRQQQRAPLPPGRRACATRAPGCRRRASPKSTVDASGRLHRVDVQPCAVAAAKRGGLGDRLDGAGLVVGQHQAGQGALHQPPECQVAPVTIDRQNVAPAGRRIAAPCSVRWCRTESRRGPAPAPRARAPDAASC